MQNFSYKEFPEEYFRNKRGNSPNTVMRLELQNKVNIFIYNLTKRYKQVRWNKHTFYKAFGKWLDEELSVQVS